MKKKCKECDKEFVCSKYTPYRKFCSGKCYSKFYYRKHRNDILKREREYRKTRNFKKSQKKYRRRCIRFKGKRVDVGYNPHKGVCELCGKRDEETVLHHIKHGEHPLEYTVELCRSCHAEIHYDPKKLPPRGFVKGHPYYPGRWNNDD